MNKEELEKVEQLIEQKNSEELKGLLSDRKSTRLNSSHRCIAYAVFCLKKERGG